MSKSPKLTSSSTMSSNARRSKRTRPAFGPTKAQHLPSPSRAANRQHRPDMHLDQNPVSRREQHSSPSAASASFTKANHLDLAPRAHEMKPRRVPFQMCLGCDWRAAGPPRSSSAPALVLICSNHGTDPLLPSLNPGSCTESGRLVLAWSMLRTRGAPPNQRRRARPAPTPSTAPPMTSTSRYTTSSALCFTTIGSNPHSPRPSPTAALGGKTSSIPRRPASPNLPSSRPHPH
ncbi:hypothetical protein DFP72DRAFT_436961 [Ephemerocybe angulata]|uniref:Uncharacterized protein n=1 Tax=Ephemerocybe angulata TaxID=980116 RepID=A0A8H6HTW8_9AGAR|nr:hypothetical protein DFP72DRAFT_436961 [Tulosesus angulatus]